MNQWGAESLVKDNEKKTQESSIDSNILIRDIIISFKEKQVAQNSIAVFNTLNDWNIVSGKWNLINGNMLEGKNSNSPDGSMGLGTLPNNIFSNNSIIEFKVNPKDNTQKDYYNFGIIFGFVDYKNYYVARYYSDKRNNADLHNFALGKTNYDGTISWLQVDHNIILKTSYWHKIKLIVTDEYMLIYINDFKLFKVEKTELPLNKGKISLGAYESSAIFSDIRITNLTQIPINLSLSFSLSSRFSNLTFTPHLTEKSNNPSSIESYPIIYTFPSINYTSNASTLALNDTLSLSFPADLIRPPDIIYFPTEPYQNRTFAIRLIVRGWDEQKQEWVFKEFMSPEFTWEDVAEGRTIAADGSRQ